MDNQIKQLYEAPDSDRRNSWVKVCKPCVHTQAYIPVSCVSIPFSPLIKTEVFFSRMFGRCSLNRGLYQLLTLSRPNMYLYNLLPGKPDVQPKINIAQNDSQNSKTI